MRVGAVGGRSGQDSFFRCHKWKRVIDIVSGVVCFVWIPGVHGTPVAKRLYVFCLGRGDITAVRVGVHKMSPVRRPRASRSRWLTSEEISTAFAAIGCLETVSWTDSNLVKRLGYGENTPTTILTAGKVNHLTLGLGTYCPLHDYIAVPAYENAWPEEMQPRGWPVGYR